MSGFFVDKSDCSRHQIFPGVDIFTTHGEHLMLSLVEMQPHAVVEKHSHPHEQLGLMLEGEAEFIVGGERRLVAAGQMCAFPAACPIRSSRAIDRYGRSTYFIRFATTIAERRRDAACARGGRQGCPACSIGG